MQIKTFTDDGLAALRSAVKANAKHYVGNRKTYFDRLISDGGYEKATVLKVPDFELVTQGPFSSSDIENVRIIHKALKGLPRQLLAKEVLWSELSHNELWDYIQHRRAKKLKSGKLEKIEQSYFFTTGSKRSLFVHCAAKLWWIGELIYDETAPDPYHHVRLFEKSFNEKVLIFSSSSFTANKDVALGILDAIASKDTGTEPVKRDYFVEATKHLNRISGVTLLDAIPRDEIAHRVSAHFDRVGL